MKFSAVILAGGRGLRIGGGKAHLKFGASTILEQIVSELAGCFDEILIAAAPDDPKADRIGGAAVRVIHDIQQYEGPVRAIEHALGRVQGEIVFGCSCDLPMLRGQVAKGICDTIGEFDAAIPSIAGMLQPLCAAYRTEAMASALAKMGSAGEKRMTHIVDYLRARIVAEGDLRRIDPDLSSFINVNTREDYDRALNLALNRSRLK